MASTKVGVQIAAQLQAVGEAATVGTRKAVEAASLILKSSIEGELRRDIGVDQRMSNVRKGTSSQGAKLSLGYDVKGGTNPTALLRARGPWGLLEYNTPDHQIFPRLAGIPARGISRAQRQNLIRQRQLAQAFGGRGTYAGKSPMPIKPGVFRYSVRDHPGTKGKFPFRNGMAKARPRAERELNTVVLRGVAHVWRVNSRTISTFVKD